MFRFLQLPLLDAPGDAGGGGGAPAGTAPSGTPNAGVSNTPTPVTLSEDSTFIPPGGKDPVKWGDWQKRYVDKAEFTRATQSAAQKEAQYKQQVQALEAKIAQAQQAVGANGQPPQNQLAQRLQALSEQPYVNGKAVAELVTDLYQSAVTPLAQAIQQRDQALALMYKQLQDVSKGMTSLRGQSTTETFQNLLSNTSKSVGLPDAPVINEFLQDIYLSHQGADLDQEFPKLAKTRWTELVAAVRQWDKAQADNERRKLLGIPSRGGNGTPGAPLRKGFESPEDIAKAWFPIMSGGADT